MTLSKSQFKRLIEKEIKESFSDFGRTPKRAPVAPPPDNEPSLPIRLKKKIKEDEAGSPIYSTPEDDAGIMEKLYDLAMDMEELIRGVKDQIVRSELSDIVHDIIYKVQEYEQ